MASIKRRVGSDDHAAIALLLVIGLLIALVSCGRSEALPPLPVNSHPELEVIAPDPCARDAQ